MTWRDHAACLEEDPELFFPTGNSDPAFLQIEKAKVVCGRCEIVDTCLCWAMDSRQDAGVWGDCPWTSGVPSNAALPVPVVPAQGHPRFDGSLGPGVEIPLIVLGAVERRTAS